ncbi:hypothetical protein [Pseudomonas sp. LS.1a]|uniref:hypothetical protein n=1 Tax=Pseudomonas sp. LS.1a TaxID=2920387 RepID=UPI001F147FB4|nr:hypothetical protein [Pseudomonas sp. LS.1a]UMY63915.1 hypothetical protein MKK04_12050 [Pseudomonas sp. LS.1a]
MSNSTIRDQFEAWASGQFIMPVDVIKACRYEDTYANTVLNIAWRGWAASHDQSHGQILALSRDVSIARRQKSQYFRAVKWFLASTSFEPQSIPTPVRLTLVHVARTLIEKAKRAAAEVANG